MSPCFLYVEDDEFSREIMRITLHDILGYSNVVIWENSEDFVRRLDRLTPYPDVIFLDIHMKPIDGFDMLTLVREHPRYQKTPVIALTASVMNEEVQRLRVAGFSGTLAKPLDQDTFPNLLERILRGESVWRITQ